MAEEAFSLHFPIGGVVRRSSYQDSRAEYTTPDALNIWPDDTAQERERGGTRPGVEEVDDFGGSAVNLISDVSWVNSGSLVRTVVAAAGGSLHSTTGTSFSSVGSVSSSKNLCATDISQKLYIGGGAQVRVYTPATNSLADLSSIVTEGTAPTNCKLVAKFNNRLVLAGDPSSPQNAYFSAMDDQTNWEYAPDEDDVHPTNAFELNLTDQGRIGEPIRALIEHSSSCLLFGCDSSIWAMRGDPLDGGRVVNISNSIGVHSARSWCYDPDGWLYFLSPNDGIYMMEPGCGSTPRSISRERLPKELIDLDVSTHTISMSYDVRFRGIFLGVTKDSGTSTHYWIDTRTVRGSDSVGNMSFWPTRLTELNPTSSYRLGFRASSGSESTTWIGTTDGKIIRFNRSVFQDDGASFPAYIDIGPFPVASPGRDGILARLQISLATGSEEVVASIRTGKTAQAAFEATAATSAVRPLLISGLNPMWYVRRRGPNIVLRLESNGNGDAPWSVENIVAWRQDAGELRI